MSQEETQGLPETQLSLVQTQKQGPFPDLPNGTGRGEMTSKPPGQFKGDGKGNPQTESDSPDNYTGPLKPVYEFKMMVKAWYITDSIQLVVAGVIFLNFILVMFSVTQFVLDNKDIEDICDDLDTVFITFFLIELAVNMLTSAQGVGEASIMSPLVWRWEFWVGENWSWNWFDFIVIVTPVALEGASWASSIRILRLFRVIRVLKSIAKFEALQVVASSVSKSIAGIGAVAIMIFGLMCCYAIVGVTYFGRQEFDAACTKIESPNLHMVRIVDIKKEVSILSYKEWAIKEGFDNTIYQSCGDFEALYDCFANLRRALYTTFMMMTLESWPDLCWASVSTYAYGPIYFVSFVAINALMMANLIIAVFTTRMDKVADDVKNDMAAYTERRRQLSSAILTEMGENTTVQGVDLDGDGIADEFGVDIDGDGVVDAVITAEEMAQIWTVGEPIEVYSHTIMQWCSGQVKEVNHKEKRIKVEYDVDGNTLGEKTIPFKHDSIRRPAGGAIGGSGIKVTQGTSSLATGASGRIENMGDLANILKDFQAKLDSIASKVDTLMRGDTAKI